ncbi:MAG TPA: hypothetical protein VLB84_02280, partial [Bacteroidia bacterium]|nr:hypothetical protein [Bacteroidia bacterium]
MKIQKIKFFDYRVFFNGVDNQYLISTGGKNLLIYGENGSGKTSLFKGLNDFIQGNDFVSHNQTPRIDEGFIEVELSDGTIERLTGSGTKPTNAEILNAAKLNSFLSYKELLKTYLFENEDNEVNLFSLLVNGVLKDHNLNTLGHLQTAWKELSSKTFADAKLILERANKKGELEPDELKEQIEILTDEFKKKFEKFYDELSVLIKEINSELGNILHYFDNNTEALLVLEPIKHDEFEKAKIGLEVNYYKKEISNHHDFLNEARLSSLALSIFIASIKSNPTQNNLRILLLDDIFIGLDIKLGVRFGPKQQGWEHQYKLTWTGGKIHRFTV